MPADQGKDSERFAAALEQGTPPGAVAGSELARDLAIAAMLRSRGPAFDPLPDARARAKQRLMAALREQQAGERAPGEQRPAGQVITASFGPVPVGPAPVGSTLGGAAPVGAAPVGATPSRNDVTPTTRIPVVAAPPAADRTTAEIRATAPAPHGSGARPAARPGTAADAATAAATIADGAGGQAVATVTPLARSRRSRHRMPAELARETRRSGRRPRMAILGAAAALVVVALAGAGVFVSRDALPGDALYQVKRVAESAGVALTFDENAKAKRQLELASTRLDEAARLARRAAGGEVDLDLLAATIREFDLATGAGSRLLLTSFGSAGPSSLGGLLDWANTQESRLTALRSALPASAAPRVEGSLHLLDRLQQRAEALLARSGCTDVVSGTVDDLGPLPADGPCLPRQGAPAGIPPAGTGSGSGGSRAGTATHTPSAQDPSPTPGLPAGLPDLGLDGTPLNGRTSTGQATPSGSTTAPPPAGPDALHIPLPLLGPVTLPPLLPGLPPITIG